MGYQAKHATLWLLFAHPGHEGGTMDSDKLMRSYKAEAEMYRRAVVQLLGMTQGRKRLDADEVFAIANRAHEESNRMSRVRRGAE